MQTYDTVIIGGGPAGCSAAIYASRASLTTLLVEQGIAGGQIATTDMVENYPGISSISGAGLGEALEQHARDAGAQIACDAVLELVRETDGTFALKLQDGALHARSVIACLGATPRRAGFSGEETFRGRGVSYCATCDAMFFRNKRVFVIGGGNTACEDALYLSRVAASVEVVLRRDAFRAPRGMVERMLARDNITVRYQTSILEISGQVMPERIVFQDNVSGATYEETYPKGSFGVFVLVGSEPATGLVAPFVDLAPDGSVLTDESMATKTPGLYCAGDMRSKPLRQAITAASDGAIAANAAYHYVEERFW